MTLLERLRRHVPDDHGVICVYLTEEDAQSVKRAIAIAQAVEEWGSELSEARGETLTAKELILDRADELLAKEGKR